MLLPSLALVQGRLRFGRTREQYAAFDAMGREDAGGDAGDAGDAGGTEDAGDGVGPDVEVSLAVMEHFNVRTVGEAEKLVRKLSLRDLQAKFEAIYGTPAYGRDKGCLQSKLLDAIRGQVYENEPGTVRQRVFEQVGGTSGMRRSHFEDKDEVFVEIVMDNQVSKVAAAEILFAVPQYVMLLTLRWQERVVDSGLGEVEAGVGTRRYPSSLPCLSSVEYVLHAIRLFVSLCPTFRVMQTSLTVFDREYERMLTDALTMVLLAVSSEFGKRQLVEALGETEGEAEGLLARDAAAMLDVVPAAIHALFVFLTEKSRGLLNNGRAKEEWSRHFEEEIEPDVVHERLELMERGWMFLPAAVEATRTLGQLLLFRLRKENDACFLNAGLLAQRLEFSVMLLEQVLVDQGAFGWFSEVEGNVTALGRLVCTVLELVTHRRATSPYICVPNPENPDGEPVREARVRPTDGRAGEWFYDTDQCRGYAGFAVSQMCALLVSLAFHDPSFSDVLAEGGKEAETVVEVMIRGVLTLGQQVMLRPSVMVYEVSPGESQLTINFMRLSEIVSDDTNFKARLHVEMIDVMRDVLCQDRSAFRSMWGPMGAQAIFLMCQDKHMVNSKSKELRMNAESCKKAVKAFMGEIRRKTNAPEENQAFDRLSNEDLELGVSLALERVVLLIKLIGNLQMQHEEGGPTTFGGLLGEAIKMKTGGDPPAMLDAKENIEYLVYLAHEFRGMGKIKLAVPLLERDELGYFEVFKESAEDILSSNVGELGWV